MTTGIRKIHNRGIHRVIGKFPSIKTGKSIWWESQIERDYCFYLEIDSDAEYYESQPFQINFKFRGVPRRYTPDFLVIRPNCKQLVEIKPLAKTKTEEFQEKILNIKAVCRDNGYEFLVVTDIVFLVKRI